MHFNISKANQASHFEHTIKAKFYQGLHESSKKTSVIRITGLCVGVVSGLLTVAKRIGRIAEEIVKGFMNILGAICGVKSCSFLRGLEMLLRASYETAIRLPLSLLSAVFGLFSKTIMILVNPTDYSHKLWKRHDPVEKARCKQTKANKQAQLDQTNFQNAKANFDNNPNDLQNTKFVAHCYLNGIGTPADQSQAIVCYMVAAMHLNDIESMKILADIAKKNNSYLEWWTFYNQAAGCGDGDANYQVGLIYLSLGNKDAALPFIREAYQKGSLSAQQVYHLTYNGCHEPVLPATKLLDLNLKVLNDQVESSKMADLLRSSI